MNFSKVFGSPCPHKGSGGAARRQIGVFLAAGLLSACGVFGDDQPKGTIGYVEGFLGGVTADVPRAALIGRDILAAGGVAVDAAVAVYFALAVTLPGSASLGGGGVCLVQDRKTGNTEALEFLPRRAKIVPDTATRPSAVPGNVRGFFALHSKYGRMRWGQLISPAENLARFGVPVSRALVKNLVGVEGALLADSESRRVFGREGGRRAVREGETLVQIDLAASLSRLRIQGAGALYNGQMAQQLVDAVQISEGSLSIEDLRQYLPRWVPTIKIPVGNEILHFAPPPAAAGGVAAQMWSILVDRFEDVPAEERLHLLVETAMRAYGDRARWMRGDGTSKESVKDLLAAPRIEALMRSYGGQKHTAARNLRPSPVQRAENSSATGFVVVDREGSAVACIVTLNSAFGTGRVAQGMGILLAAQPGAGGRGAASLVPVILANNNSNELYFAGTATGGAVAPTALMNVMARHLIAGQSLHDAMAAKRVHHGGLPDVAYYEKGLGAPLVYTLTRRRHETAPTYRLGVVNAISCSGGLPPKPGTCVALADPRGFGLAATADQ